jgi:hypothetical protein
LPVNVIVEAGAPQRCVEAPAVISQAQRGFEGICAFEIEA